MAGTKCQSPAPSNQSKSCLNYTLCTKLRVVLTYSNRSLHKLVIRWRNPSVEYQKSQRATLSSVYALRMMNIKINLYITQFQRRSRNCMCSTGLKFPRTSDCITAPIMTMLHIAPLQRTWKININLSYRKIKQKLK